MCRTRCNSIPVENGLASSPASDKFCSTICSGYPVTSKTFSRGLSSWSSPGLPWQNHIREQQTNGVAVLIEDAYRFD